MNHVSISCPFRCPSDPTAKLTVDSDLKSTLRFEAFTFLSSPNSIYLECEVIMCLASTVDSRCDLCSSKRKRRRDIEDMDTYGYHRIRSKSFFVIPKPIYSEKGMICFFLLTIRNGAFIQMSVGGRL